MTCALDAGRVDLDEFREAIRTCRAATKIFTGSEELNRLTEKQMDALLLYDDWPQKHEGPSDVGESEGLGGLMEHVKKDHKVIEEDGDASDTEESEEHADRRHALSPGGPRDEFPLLVELDVLAAEIQELEKIGGLTGYSDWRDDVKQAENIFLETPDDLPAWLDRMRTKKLSKPVKYQKVVRCLT